MPRHRPRQPQFDSRDSLLDGPALTLDLHGETSHAARTRVAQFLAATARAHPGSLVHVVTGRGRGSGAAGPKLRPMVATLLKGECAPLVRDWARDTDEGGFRIRLR